MQINSSIAFFLCLTITRVVSRQKIIDKSEIKLILYQVDFYAIRLASCLGIICHGQGVHEEQSIDRILSTAEHQISSYLCSVARRRTAANRTHQLCLWRQLRQQREISRGSIKLCEEDSIHSQLVHLDLAIKHQIIHRGPYTLLHSGVIDRFMTWNPWPRRNRPMLSIPMVCVGI